MIQHYKVESSGRLLNYFADHGLSAPGVDFPWLLDFGAVYVNKKRVLADRQLNVGDQLRIHCNPRRFSVPSLTNRIVFENSEFIVVDKPSGLPVHESLDNRIENLRHQLGGELLITSRLDVETSGLIVLAKTKDFQLKFNKLLEEKKVTKIYRALVEKPIEPSVYEHHMLKSKRAPKILVGEASEKTLLCRLEVLKCEPLVNNFSLKIKLLTGRTHQIRAQLSDLGAPIVGDSMYGGAESPKFGLRCVQLAFGQVFSLA